MNILGYASLNHDPSVALVSGGRTVAAIESEKITRAKHEVSLFPEAAIEAVLRWAKLTFADIDVVAANYDAGPIANMFYLPHLIRMLRAGSLDLTGVANCLVIAGVHHPKMFARLNDGRAPRVVTVKHHHAHLAASFLTSPWEDAAVAIIDAAGELECSSLWDCSGRSVRKLDSMDLPADSLGSVYMLSTRHLGFKMLGDEYKVMGLAPYGAPNPEFRAFFDDLIRLQPGGRYRVDARLLGKVAGSGLMFPEPTRIRLGPARKSGEPITDRHADFAFELQRRIEAAILHMTRHLRQVTGRRRLCLGGGVALNCVANGVVARDSGFDDVFVPPAPHDAGTALGAALHHHFYTLGEPRPEPMTTPYLGAAYGDDEIARDLNRAGQVFDRLDDRAGAAASALAAGLVIGWFQGAAEFGPRALGNRSILADARRPEMKAKVNATVKEREGFRPFAPAILESRAPVWFETLVRSPWMLFVDRVRAERREQIPAVVHIDGTARPQTVSPADNPLFHDLLLAFESLTGVPLVLNTSFNVAGEPIVCTPNEALRCFQGSGLDALFIGPFLLRKTHVRWNPPVRTCQNAEEASI